LRPASRIGRIGSCRSQRFATLVGFRTGSHDGQRISHPGFPFGRVFRRYARLLVESRLSRAESKRLSLDSVRDVLDVGCGVGHWGRMLARVLPSSARVQDVGREAFWVEKAAARATAHGLA